MREMKFRAWDNINKCMELDIHHLDSLNEYLHKDKYNVMQFTGLKDKNGVDIYESDFVEYTLNHDSDKNKIKSKIEFIKYAWRLNGLWLLTEISSIEVIGNIYEHPNSLEL